MRKRFIGIMATLLSLSLVGCLNPSNNSEESSSLPDADGASSVSVVESSLTDESMDESVEESVGDSVNDSETTEDSAVEETVSTQVTEDVWRTIFSNSNWENVTLTGKMVDLTDSGEFWEIDHTVRIDGDLGEQVQHSDVSSYHRWNPEKGAYESWFEEEPYDYIEVCFKKEGSYSSYWKGYANTWREREPSFVYNADMISAMMPFSEYYASFTYNEETQTYEGGNIVFELAGLTIKYKSIVLKFENNQLKSIDSKFEEVVDFGLDLIAMSYEFSDFGTTKVVIPDVEISQN